MVGTGFISSETDPDPFAGKNLDLAHFGLPDPRDGTPRMSTDRATTRNARKGMADCSGTAPEVLLCGLQTAAT